jgi:hypothetical protein
VKKNHKLVTPELCGGLVDHADPIAVAVERDADVGIVCLPAAIRSIRDFDSTVGSG